jgi:polyamine oxidase
VRFTSSSPKFLRLFVQLINLPPTVLLEGPLPFFSDMYLPRISRPFAFLGLLSTVSGVLAQDATNTPAPPASNHTTVLILGGGMAGIIAARTLHEQGIDDFIILEAKIELGGRMIPKAFGVPGRQVVVEIGPNWIQGTQQGNGTANPIWELALKHNLSTVYSDMYGSISTLES